MRVATLGRAVLEVGEAALGDQVGSSRVDLGWNVETRIHLSVSSSSQT